MMIGYWGKKDEDIENQKKGENGRNILKVINPQGRGLRKEIDDYYYYDDNDYYCQLITVSLCRSKEIKG